MDIICVNCSNKIKHYEGFISTFRGPIHSDLNCCLNNLRLNNNAINTNLQTEIKTLTDDLKHQKELTQQALSDLVVMRDAYTALRKEMSDLAGAGITNLMRECNKRDEIKKLLEQINKVLES
jgi:hypothetical protein